MPVRYLMLLLLTAAGMAGAENYAYDPAKMHALQKQHCQKFLDQQAVIEKRELLGFNQRWDLEKMASKKAELQKQFDAECQPVREELLSSAVKPATAAGRAGHK